MNGGVERDSTVREAQVWEEVPGFFPAGDEVLFGVLTRPLEDAKEVAVLLVPGGWRGTSIGINQLFVRLGRRLAAKGHTSMRFDYHGVGESTGQLDGFRLHQPFSADLEGAVDWMKSNGISKFVAVGICFGARTVLARSAALSGLAGLCLISIPVHDGGRGPKLARMAGRITFRDLLRRVKNPWFIRNVLTADVRRLFFRVLKARVSRVKHGSGGSAGSAPGEGVESSLFLSGMRDVVAQRLQTLLVYGSVDEDYEVFQQGLNGRLGELIKTSDGQIQVDVIPGSIHGFTRLEAQERVLGAVIQWVEDSEKGAVVAAQDLHSGDNLVLRDGYRPRS